MPGITDTYLKLKVICTELPGTRFEDPHAHKPKIKEPVYLGIQRGKEVIEQVSADRREVVFYPEFRVGEKPDGAPNFLGPYAQGRPADRFFIFPGAWCEIRVILRCFDDSKFVLDISIGRRLIGHLSRVIPLL